MSDPSATHRPVQITDADVPFFTLAWWLFKLSFAMIPAAILVALVSLAAIGVLRVLGLIAGS